MQQLGSVGTDIAKPLDGDARANQITIHFAQRLARHEQQPAAGCLESSTRTAERDRLASYHARLDVALLHREGVHHPGHNLWAGADVGRGNVDGWTDQVENPGDVAAGE